MGSETNISCPERVDNLMHSNIIDRKNNQIYLFLEDYFFAERIQPGASWARHARRAREKYFSFG